MGTYQQLEAQWRMVKVWRATLIIEAILTQTGEVTWIGVHENTIFLRGGIIIA